MKYRDDNFGFVLQEPFDFSPARALERYADRAPIIEIMRDESRGRWRIIRNGWVGLSGPAAIQAVEAVMNRLLYTEPPSGRQDAKDKIRTMLQRAFQNKTNLKQIADDKAWPIFWASMCMDTDRVGVFKYSRDGAKESISKFCKKLMLSKSDWAWLCNREPFYLYEIFSMRPGFQCIRWHQDMLDDVPEHLINVPDFLEWLKRYYLQPSPARIDRREFQMVCQDVLDARAHCLDLSKAYRAKTWEDFCRRLHGIEGARRPRYGRSPAFMADLTSMRNYMVPPRGEMSMRQFRGRNIDFLTFDEASGIDETIIRALRIDPYMSTASDGVGQNTSAEQIMRARAMVESNNISREVFERHMGEMLNYGMAMSRIATAVDESKPATATPFAWMKAREFLLEHNGGPKGMRARLLADDVAVWEEATRMRHCLYRSYTGKMKAEDYIAYHFETPHLGPDHKGWTAGFKRSNTPPEGWVVDQVRGHLNAFNKDTDLDAFVGQIAESLNAAEEKHALL